MRIGFPTVLILTLLAPGLTLAQTVLPPLAPPPVVSSGNAALAPVLVPGPAPSGQTDACPAEDDSRSPQIWGRAEYLLWWTKKIPVSTPLVTSALTGPFTSGAIGQQGTQVLLGESDYNLHERQGGRFTVGGWLTPDQVCGVEGSYLFLKGETRTYVVKGDGSFASPTLGIPYFDTSIPGETFSGFNVPGISSGFNALFLRNSLQGWEGNMVTRLLNQDCFRLDGLAGFRYLQFREQLGFFSNFQGIPGSGLEGVSLNAMDVFDARNDFYGAQVGLRGEYQSGCGFFVNATGKVALGSMNENMNIAGGGSLVTPFIASPFTINQGIFTAGTNSGKFNRCRFSVVPEADLNVGYQCKCVRVFVGYTALYASEVVRPGQQLDHLGNVTGSILSASSSANIVGQNRPTFSWTSTDFWAQGVNFGVQFSF